jgi:hypothetical protein
LQDQETNNFTNEVYGWRKGVSLIKSKRGEGEGSLGSVNTIEGDAKKQDKFGWFIGEV